MKKRCLIYGDSNTYGLDPREAHSGKKYPDNILFTNRLKKALSGELDIVVNAKVGRCIPSMDFELEEFYKIIEEIGEIDVFFVMLGTNDYLSIPKPDPDKVSERMKKFLKIVNTMIEDVKILLVAPPYLNFNNDKYYEKFNTTDGRLSKSLKRVSDELRISFFDAGKLNLPIYRDGIHLLPEAEEILSVALEPKIRELISCKQHLNNI